jgi:hypothetical protein
MCNPCVAGGEAKGRKDTSEASAIDVFIYLYK